MFNELFDDFNTTEISGLTLELRSIYLANLLEKENRSQLVICNSLFEANKVYDYLKKYCSKTLLFPMDDFITSEVLAISPEFEAIRLETLDSSKLDNKLIVVTNLMGALRYLPNPALFYSKYVNIKVNQDYNLKQLVTDLYNIGYKKEVLVNKSGEMAIRGFVVDLFPINHDNPIRIEFWGDTIESIREFDVDTQLTKNNLEEVEIMCSSEFILEEENDVLKKQRNLINYQKVFSIIDYLKGSTIVYNDIEDLKISYTNLLNDILEFSISNNLDPATPFMNDFLKIVQQNKNYISFNNFGKEENYKSFLIEEKFADINKIEAILNNYLKKYKNIVICVSNRYQVNKILELIESAVFTDELNIFEHKINVIIKNITDGFIFNNYVVISEKEIFNKKETLSTYKSNFKLGSKIKDITHLNIGDYIVHNVHGIGKYCGIKTITKKKLAKDYLHIMYKDEDYLYIPVEKIELISKYSSNEEYQPKLSKLGSLEWEKTKMRARQKAEGIALELLNLYALREMQEGFKFEDDDENQIEFEKQFIYEPTISQLKVIEEIKKDMCSPHPMDRLLCGDVGYGKTEAAFRAAFKAILSNKQVILLCPTTILSNQHYQNALERFKEFPVNIKILNRFVSAKDVSTTLKGLENGTIDFVIGTHKLLNIDIVYKNLGLLIIDEEQRFGVTHKETIKKYRNNIDVLTLSATPIPRTLQMSMSGVRSLSLLETPPNNRYPIQTYVVAHNLKIIKDAIYKELSRQGQTFILYNRVNDIASKAKEINVLVPESKVVYAHGRMNKTEIEDIMLKFISGEYDVLVCTTIIETGIDIPNANTLIVIDADKFGLSQLYQLRGRVGRTNKVAYCYLMYSTNKILTEIATKRLNAIKEFTELGSGLSIAMRDLAIRGAGDILGSEQAGFVDSIGIELFMKILKEEIDKLKGIIIPEVDEKSNPLIEVSTSVSNNYVIEEKLKIEIHKKINEIDSLFKLNEIKIELEDRFGKLSNDLIIYMHEQLFEVLSKKSKIKKVIQNDNFIELIFDKEISSKIDGEKIFFKLFDISPNFKIGLKLGCLIIKLNINNLEKHFIYYLIEVVNLIIDNL